MWAAVLPRRVLPGAILGMLCRGCRNVFGEEPCAALPCVVQFGGHCGGSLAPLRECTAVFGGTCVVCCRHARLLHLRGRCIPQYNARLLYTFFHSLQGQPCRLPCAGVPQERAAMLGDLHKRHPPHPETWDAASG